jgi:transposase
MDCSSCPGCQQLSALAAELRAQVAALQAQVRDLEARLGQNASNFSLPRSANPPASPKPVVKKSTDRGTGAQPGHTAHLKRRLPRGALTRTVPFVPRHCERCQGPLPATPGPDDPGPTWHQVAELPEMVAQVTQYQGHFRTCPGCGALNHAPIPRDLKAHSVGPRLAAALAYPAGSHHVSQRGLEEVA